MLAIRPDFRMLSENETKIMQLSRKMMQLARSWTNETIWNVVSRF